MPGDLVILKGQRKGRFHLEGGIVMYVDGGAVGIMCDSYTWVTPLEKIEKFTADYVTPNGNNLVPVEGSEFIATKEGNV